MAARKVKSAANGRARKKTAKSPTVRGRGAKSAAKRTRRAASTTKAKGKSAVKSPRVTRTVQPVTAVVAVRKPTKKAEPRPQRPPAVLPIPQSTFFF
jgi:hypothetical protein